MSVSTKQRWERLEQWRSTAFLIAGLLFVLDALLVAGIIVALGERYMTLGQAFVGAAWTAAFLGLFGLYPELVERSRRLTQAGAVCAAIGTVVFVVMGVASLVYFAGVVDGSLESLVPVFLPGVIVGSIVGFLLFGAASLRTDTPSRAVGVLLLLPALIVVLNIGTGIAGISSQEATLAVVIGQALAHLALGYSLRSSRRTTGRHPAASAAK